VNTVAVIGDDIHSAVQAMEELLTTHKETQYHIQFAKHFVRRLAFSMN